MRSIRKFAYAAVLGLSIFTIQPTLAAAEDAHGVFTLSHEVHWQNSVLRPGDYTFSLKTSGSPALLLLRGLNGTGTDATLLVMSKLPRRAGPASSFWCRERAKVSSAPWKSLGAT